MGNIYGLIFTNALVVTPSDTVDLPQQAVAIAVLGGTGATVVKVDTVGGQTVSIPIPVGYTIIPLMIKRVYSTGSTLGTSGAVMALW